MNISCYSEFSCYFSGVGAGIGAGKSNTLMSGFIDRERFFKDTGSDLIIPGKFFYSFLSVCYSFKWFDFFDLNAFDCPKLYFVANESPG